MPFRRYALYSLLLMLCCAPAYAFDSEDNESTAPLDYAVAFPTNPVRLPQLLSDGAVLQRDREIPIWGWGQEGQRVTISIAGQSTSVTVGLQNLWATTIGPLSAGGPFSLVVSDGHTTVTSRHVLIGDVWMCGGQSSMAQTLAGVADPEKEIAAANVPALRLFQVPRTTAFAPQNDFPPPAHWTPCTSDTARAFSAIGYFFGRRLREHYDVPVGIISATWVNTTIPLWMSEAAASQAPDYDWWLNALRRTSTPVGRARLDDEQRWRDWLTELQDKADGSTGTRAWYSRDLLMGRHWKTMRLPSPWEARGLPDLDGVVWFRKQFELTEPWTHTSPTLSLAHFYDYGTVWFNGEQIAASDDWKTTVVCQVPPRLLRTGRNTVAVRILDTHLYGGIHGTTDSLVLQTTTTEGFTSLPLAGDWRYRVGLNIKGIPRPWASTEQWPHPGAMYNGMIAPLVNHAIRGVVWYQGEADDYQANRYRHLLAILIRDWRNRWKQKDLPFIIAQIASWLPHADEPQESRWAEVRESQSYVENNVPHVAVAPMYDLGATTEPHYLRKREAAERLFNAARNTAYGETAVPYRGPAYRPKSMKIVGSKVRVSFDTTTGGLVMHGQKLRGFQLAGANRKYFWADAQLVSTDTLQLHSDKVRYPVAVRFGWQNHPWATLYNEEGLPAMPFRTDRWPTNTAGIP
ncbi:MAG: sialate O-acetylesterase [Candidatus Sumerlaeaceae bacterium]